MASFRCRGSTLVLVFQFQPLAQPGFPNFFLCNFDVTTINDVSRRMMAASNGSAMIQSQAKQASGTWHGMIARGPIKVGTKVRWLQGPTLAGSTRPDEDKN
jgi:hypothetical protein